MKNILIFAFVLVLCALSQAQSSNPALSQETKHQLQAMAWELSQIWGDTILEGDYYAEQKVRLESVQLIYENQQLVAYHITYSSKAWKTSHCQFDGVHKATLQNCEAGRIVESGIVAADFSTAAQDPERPVTFLPDRL